MKKQNLKIYFVIFLLFSYSFSSNEFLTKQNDIFKNPNTVLKRYKNSDLKLYKEKPPMLKKNRKVKDKDKDFDIGYDININRQTGELEKYYFDIKKKF